MTSDRADGEVVDGGRWCRLLCCCARCSLTPDERPHTALRHAQNLRRSRIRPAKNRHESIAGNKMMQHREREMAKTVTQNTLCLGLVPEKQQYIKGITSKVPKYVYHY